LNVLYLPHFVYVGLYQLRPTGAKINDKKAPLLPIDASGKFDLKAMMDTGIIPRRETANSKVK